MMHHEYPQCIMSTHDVVVVVVLVVVVVVAAAVVVALLFIDACRSRPVLSIRGLMALWALGWSYVPPRPYPQAWAPVTTEVHATKAKTKTKRREQNEAGNGGSRKQEAGLSLVIHNLRPASSFWAALD